MSYLRCRPPALGADDDAEAPSGDLAALHRKVDELTERQERGIRLREVSIALTSAGLIVGLLRLGHIAQQLRQRRREGR